MRSAQNLIDVGTPSGQGRQPVRSEASRTRRYPSLTASASPATPITTRSGPAGAWRTTIGPSRDPSRHPMPSGTTAGHCTGAKIAKTTAATPFATPRITFLPALACASVRVAGAAGTARAAARRPPRRSSRRRCRSRRSRQTSSSTLAVCRWWSATRRSAVARRGSGSRPRPAEQDRHDPLEALRGVDNSSAAPPRRRPPRRGRCA